MTCLIAIVVLVVVALFLLAGSVDAGKTEHEKRTPDDPREF
jgi:hypothetical protein